MGPRMAHDSSKVTSQGPAYTSVVRVMRHGKSDRSASMPGGETVKFGIHGGIAKAYGRSTEGLEPTSATLDYLVAAAGG